MRRRSFVAAIVSALLAACGGAKTAASPAGLDDFMKLSVQLTGYADLDASIGAVYLQSILAQPALAAALSSPMSDDPAHLALADTILACWYSGKYASAGGTVTATWTQALAWRACSYTKPPSICAAPGSWAKRPA